MIEVFIKCLCGAEAVAVRRVEQYAKDNRIMINVMKTRGTGSVKLEVDKHKQYAEQIGLTKNNGVVVYDNGKKVVRLLEWKP